jgi:predicted ABC-type ATPase
VLHCFEFVNADEIVKGISPFQREKVSFEAGRIMLNRIDELLKRSVDMRDNKIVRLTFSQ